MMGCVSWLRIFFFHQLDIICPDYLSSQKQMDAHCSPVCGAVALCYLIDFDKMLLLVDAKSLVPLDVSSKDIQGSNPPSPSYWIIKNKK